MTQPKTDSGYCSVSATGSRPNIFPAFSSTIYFPIPCRPARVQPKVLAAQLNDVYCRLAHCCEVFQLNLKQKFSLMANPIVSKVFPIGPTFLQWVRSKHFITIGRERQEHLCVCLCVVIGDERPLQVCVFIRRWTSKLHSGLIKMFDCVGVYVRVLP